MLKEDEIGQLTQKCDQVARWQIEWRLVDILLHRLQDKPYCSPSFYYFGVRWYLKIYPGGESDKNSTGWIGVYLCKEDACVPEMRANVTLGIRKVDGEVVNQKHGDLTGVLAHDGTEFGHPKFFHRFHLKDNAELLPSNVLTLTCTLVVNDRALTNAVQRNVLSENFAELLMSRIRCDVLLKLQHHRIPAHKLILSARSPVFEVMFETDMRERLTGVVEIVDCDPEAFRCFLLYLYSGKFEIDPDKVFKLYRIAHKYWVEDLKSACVLSIMCHLSIENFCEAIVLGNEFGECQLQSKIYQFFHSNYNAIRASTHFQSFMKSHWTLANELLKSRPAPLT